MQSLIPFEIVYRARPDLRVLGAMLGFCVLSTLISGLGPAWKLSRPDVVTDLKEHAGEDTGAARGRPFPGATSLSSRSSRSRSHSWWRPGSLSAGP